ncbi:MAG: tRNA-dihydrouridine synthase family protein [Prevotella sp.]|nr:tRNA-dihydrouridine synthase family protein [Candidatus Prevotella equi]
MNIGNIDLGNRPLFLAPMEDVTDVGFRRLCKRYGASMVYSEFVAAEALVRNIKSTVRKLTISDDERPVGIQIYGRTTKDVVEAARIVEAEAHPDVIDLNFGCPVKKVAGKGAGAGMLQNIPLLLDITENVAKAVSTPVTVKTRLGWTTSDYVFGNALSEQFTPADGWNGKDLAEHLYDCGAQALTIHGRTRAQMYTGDADWTLIGDVARRMKGRMPVIGNGDITTLQEADNAFDTYDVDAVMIGRATFGQPWLFSQEAQTTMTVSEKIDILLELLNINLEYVGDEHRAILHTRRHLAATPVFKGIPNFRETRIKLLRADTVKEVKEVMEAIRELLVQSA